MGINMENLTGPKGGPYASFTSSDAQVWKEVLGLWDLTCKSGQTARVPHVVNFRISAILKILRIFAKTNLINAAFLGKLGKFCNTLF